MSREIKFKLWDKDFECFVPNDRFAVLSTDNPRQLAICIKAWENVREGEIWYSHQGELLLLSNLTDSNGKEMYEGYIVSDVNMKDLFQIVFTDWGNFGLRPISSDIKKYFNKHNRVYEYEPIDPAYTKTTLEVIGNIYENPELLEATHD